MIPKKIVLAVGALSLLLIGGIAAAASEETRGGEVNTTNITLGIGIVAIMGALSYAKSFGGFAKLG